LVTMGSVVTSAEAAVSEVSVLVLMFAGPPASIG
jgi:hypothetical protein